MNAFDGALTMLGVLVGAYLAKTSGENRLRYGVRMLAVGCITAFMGFALALVLGQSPA